MAYSKTLANGTETKPGLFTTEFLFALAFNAGAVLELVADPFNIPNKYVVFAMAAVTAIYSASRGLAKQGGVYVPVEDYDPNQPPPAPPQA